MWKYPQFVIPDLIFVKLVIIYCIYENWHMATVVSKFSKSQRLLLYKQYFWGNCLCYMVMIMIHGNIVCDQIHPRWNWQKFRLDIINMHRNVRNEVVLPSCVVLRFFFKKKVVLHGFLYDVNNNVCGRCPYLHLGYIFLVFQPPVNPGKLCHCVPYRSL